MTDKTDTPYEPLTLQEVELEIEVMEGVGGARITEAHAKNNYTPVLLQLRDTMQREAELKCQIEQKSKLVRSALLCTQKNAELRAEVEKLEKGIESLRVKPDDAGESIIFVDENETSYYLDEDTLNHRIDALLDNTKGDGDEKENL